MAFCRSELTIPSRLYKQYKAILFSHLPTLRFSVALCLWGIPFRLPVPGIISTILADFKTLTPGGKKSYPLFIHSCSLIAEVLAFLPRHSHPKRRISIAILILSNNDYSPHWVILLAGCLIQAIIYLGFCV
jgi:hypothetical protein